MSSASSVITYTSVYTDSKPKRAFWGADEELSDGGPEHPPSPDYVPGLKHPPSLVDVPYIAEPEYPEYLVSSNVEAPLEDQSLPVDASPTTLSPGYVAVSDLEEDPEEDPEEDHADYPAKGGDGDDEPSYDDDYIDDEDEEPSKDEDDDEEEEEYLALTDSFVVPVVNLVPSAGDTEAFETDESAPTHRPPQTMAHIAEYAAAPTPPLPASSLPLPLPSPLTTSSTDAGAPLVYRLVGIKMRALLPSTSYRTNIPKAEMLPQKRACFTTPAPGLKSGRVWQLVLRDSQGLLWRATLGEAGLRR
ncbi:hypothetical protein Tco_0139860 [Tanacetum coccineum]